MSLRRSKAGKAKEARDAVTEQVSDRTDDLLAALDAAREALTRASAAAGRKSAELADELGKEASKAADKLLPERARQRRREAARKRRRRVLAGTAGLVGIGLLASRLTGSKGEPEEGFAAPAGEAGGSWDRAGQDADSAPTAEVTQLHQGNSTSTNPARTPPS
jgi:hypothetical protein